jgi:hypothetical protein
MKLTKYQLDVLGIALREGSVSKYEAHGTTLESLGRKGMLQIVGAHLSTPSGKGIWLRYALTDAGYVAYEQGQLTTSSVKGLK